MRPSKDIKGRRGPRKAGGTRPRPSKNAWPPTPRSNARKRRMRRSESWPKPSRRGREEEAERERQLAAEEARKAEVVRRKVDKPIGGRQRRGRRRFDQAGRGRGHRGRRRTGCRHQADAGRSVGCYRSGNRERRAVQRRLASHRREFADIGFRRTITGRHGRGSNRLRGGTHRLHRRRQGQRPRGR